MAAVKSSDLRIQHQCPQCGAPATLLESDRLFSCAYCRVKSYLLPRGIARYRLPHKGKPDGRALVYFPYWRFKGMVFSCFARGTEARFVDTSHQAFLSPRFPLSLGLRSQALTLGVVTAGTPGHFIAPQVSLAEVTSHFNRRLHREQSQALLHQAHIGESVSLIYAPYYWGPKLIDAVLDRPVPGHQGPPLRLEDFPGCPHAARFDFVATLCPQCGWDLEGARNAQVLNCRHCYSLWQPGATGLTPVPCAHVPTMDREAVYLPFWRIQAGVAGIDLSSYADLARLANLPKAIPAAWEKIPYRFWAPAFKIRPRVFLRLARVLSTALPPEPIAASVPRQACLSATLPVGEAVETLKANLAGLIKPQERMSALLPQVDPKPRKALLVYLPFEDRPHELVSTALNVAVNKHQMSLAWNL